MNYSQVKELIEIIDSSSIRDFELSMEQTVVKMSKDRLGSGTTSNINKPTDYSGVNVSGASVGKDLDEPITLIPDHKPQPLEGNMITSPIVGTFYDKPSPDKKPFVQKGDFVKSGDVVCIVEAMKIMNEITSQYTGKVAEVLALSEDMVEYGQPLFRIVKE